MPPDDGVAIELAGLRVETIREPLEYGGLRLRTAAAVAGARVAIVIDIGFGDAIEPGLEDIELPVLLDQPAPRLKAYARETVIAEKFQAMVLLGLANTRFKDFYDLWTLSNLFVFDDDRLARAIAATFERRRTAIPIHPPVALTPIFAADPTRRRQWAAYIEDLGLAGLALGEVTAGLAVFIMPHAERARGLAVTTL